MFRTWAAELPTAEVCAIQLPGRDARRREPAFTRLQPLVEQLVDGLEPCLDLPFAFFGYSLGALVAFEAARRLRRQKSRSPLHLLVAARAAPQWPNQDIDLHPLPDNVLVEEVRSRYDGIPTQILQEPDLLKMFLPLLRADLAVMETYQHQREEPLACPISAFGGLDDRMVNQESLEAWREQTARPFALQMLPGNHFFLNTARSPLLQSIQEQLGPHLG